VIVLFIMINIAANCRNYEWALHSKLVNRSVRNLSLFRHPNDQ
jgi:hypothetical protein